MRVPGTTILRDVARAAIGAARTARSDPPAPKRPVDIVELVDELLDAHADIADLAAELEWYGDTRWRAHLEHLRALQRVGREALAQLEAERVG